MLATSHASRPFPGRASIAAWPRAMLRSYCAPGQSIVAPMWIVVTALLAAACGYGMEAPHLPNDHRTLAVNPIRNRTFEGELDVRLQQALRRALFRTASVEVAAPEDSGLLLTVDIQSLDLARARSLDSTEIKRLTYRISGTITLLEQASGKILIDRLPVSVSARYELPEADVETPAVRDDAVNEVVASFADAIVARLLVNFDPADRPPAINTEGAPPGPAG